MNCKEIVLFAVVLAACQVQLCLAAGLLDCIFGSGNSSPQNRISSYLVSKLGSSNGDVQANLAEANKWLLELDERRAKSRNRKRDTFEEALHSFVSLEKALNLDSCGQEGHSILLANDKLLQAPKSKADNQANRAGDILQQVKRQHEKLCEHQYEQLVYGRELAQLEEKTPIDQLEMFLSEDFIHKSLETNQFLDKVVHFAQLIEAGVFEGPLRFIGNDRVPVARYARKVIETYASKESDGKLAMKCLKQFKPTNCLPEIRKMLVKYLEAPCKYYVDSLGPKVFLPHEYDLKSMEDLEGREGELADFDLNNLSQYQLAWSRFNYCRFGISGKSVYQADSSLVKTLLGSWASEYAAAGGKDDDEDEDEDNEDEHDE